LKIGGTFWTKSEPTLNRIRTNCRPAGGNPTQRLAACRRTKPAKISFSFNGRAQKIFSIKETIFAGFASLLTQGQAASHPCRAFGAESRRAKIPSPRPPSFLPACWKPPAIFSDGGGTSNWAAGGVSLF
jgi:hypothetical protein